MDIYTLYHDLITWYLLPFFLIELISSLAVTGGVIIILLGDGYLDTGIFHIPNLWSSQELALNSGVYPLLLMAYESAPLVSKMRGIYLLFYIYIIL